MCTLASSSSFRRRWIWMRSLTGTFLIPCIADGSLVSGQGARCGSKVLTCRFGSAGCASLASYPHPDGLVELHIEPDILGAHLLLCKLPDFLHSLWCTLLESHIVQPLVQVDGVLAGDSATHGPLLVDHGRCCCCSFAYRLCPFRTLLPDQGAARTCCQLIGSRM